ncbi:hypothetical protein [Psychrobacillus sp. FSL K6-1267]|uniref:hypothetical protein n=1 Tax=Psychrobacillus sp. FSL K6-1267 TaxID=2921543 RepID=UPI0030F737DB
MPLRVTDIVDTIHNQNEKPKELYEKVFDEIGNHIKDNAERLANQIVDTHRGMKIEIDIPINELVNFSVKFDEYIKKSEGK